MLTYFRSSPSFAIPLNTSVTKLLWGTWIHLNIVFFFHFGSALVLRCSVYAKFKYPKRILPSGPTQSSQTSQISYHHRIVWFHSVHAIILDSQKSILWFYDYVTWFPTLHKFQWSLVARTMASIWACACIFAGVGSTGTKYRLMLRISCQFFRPLYESSGWLGDLLWALLLTPELLCGWTGMNADDRVLPFFLSNSGWRHKSSWNYGGK